MSTTHTTFVSPSPEEAFVIALQGARWHRRFGFSKQDTFKGLCEDLDRNAGGNGDHNIAFAATIAAFNEEN